MNRSKYRVLILAAGIIASLSAIAQADPPEFCTYSQPWTPPASSFRSRVVSCQNPQPMPRAAMDDFTCDEGGALGKVRWWGVLRTQQQVGRPYYIAIRSDNNCQPDALLYETCVVPEVQYVNDDCLNKHVFLFSAQIQPFMVNAGERYWLEIAENDAQSAAQGQDDFRWSGHQPVEGCPALQRNAAGVFFELHDACNEMPSDLSFEVKIKVPQQQQPPELDVVLLPEGPNGIASGANCVAVGDFDGDGDVDGADFIVGGYVRDGDTQLDVPAAFAVSSGGDRPMESLSLNLLPHLGSGGEVNAVAVLLGLGDGSFRFAGTVLDDEAQPEPAVWSYTSDEQGQLTVLPTPDNNGGEALSVATGDVNNDGAADVIVSGFSFGATQTGTMATIWVDWGDGFNRRTLPPLVEGSDAVATSAYKIEGVFVSSLMVTGYASDENGNNHAVLWTIDHDETTLITLGELAGGDESAARTMTVGKNENITIGGDSVMGDGSVRPVLWGSDGGIWRARGLALPDGFTQGRVNSILIGMLLPFIAVGEVSGSQGPAAAAWTFTGPGPSQVFDLNSLTDDLPSGHTLREANAILPYLEQDNVYLIVGTSNDSYEQGHAFVAALYRD